jgi:glycosyltransferase involved in cell wall biosynthesis/SAM-dependent methyltransferase
VRILIEAWRDLAHPQAGGSEVLVDVCARGAVASGHDVTLLAGGPVEQREYRVVDAGSTFGQYLKGPRIGRRLASEHDVMMDVSNGLGFFSPLWWSKPIVHLIHHVHTDQWPQRFPRPLSDIGQAMESRFVPWLYRNELFAAVSPSTQEQLERIGVPADKIRLLPNATDLPVNEIAEKAIEPMFFVFGRLVPHKRVDLVLRNWEKVRSRVGGRLVIAGDGPERATLEEQASRLDGVDFLGRVDDDTKEELLASSWLLLHPAQHEGWGIVVMEAAARGTPALGFDVPGVRDSIEDGRTGVLARDEDDFVRQWLTLTQDVASRAVMADHARTRAFEFGEQRTIDAFLGICEELVTTRPKRIARRPLRDDWRRSVNHLNAFRQEQSSPGDLYRLMASDMASMVHEVVDLDGARVLDVGGGPGYIADAFAERRATCVTIDKFAGELQLHGRRADHGVVADGVALPIGDARFDVVHCSNVLEHTPQPIAVLDELVRATRSGGVIAVSFTNWLGPWGGHETSPWHLLGGERAADRYRSLHRVEAKNRFGSTLFRLDVADVQQWIDQRLDLVEPILVQPRYYPRPASAVLRVPLVREFATWNLLAVLRRR